MNPDTKALVVTVCAGGVGGSLSDLFRSLGTVNPPTGVTLLQAILAGALAALAGNFIVFNANRQDIIRLAASAGVSGLFWYQTLLTTYRTLSTVVPGAIPSPPS